MINESTNETMKNNTVIIIQLYGAKSLKLLIYVAMVTNIATKHKMTVNETCHGGSSNNVSFVNNLNREPYMDSCNKSNFSLTALIMV